MAALTAKIQANFRASFVIAVSTAAVNIAANFALIGWLVRIEGFGALGIWSFLNAIALISGVLDLGIMTGASRDIARNRSRETLHRTAYLARGSEGCLIVFALGIFAIQQFTSIEPIAPFLVAALAGLMQVISGWWISIPLGHHKHYWYSLKISLRTLVQSAAVFLLTPLLASKIGLALTLALALLIGSFVELIFSRLIAGYGRDAFEQPAKGSPLTELVSTAREFALLNFLERTREPVMRFVVFLASGAAGLGQFTAAFRASAALQAIFAQAMRATVSGYAALAEQQDHRATLQITQASLLFQFLISIPCFAFLMCLLPNLLQIWLGDTNLDVLNAARWIAIGMCFNSIGATSFFRLQAMGSANIVSRYSTVALAVFAASGVLLYFYSENVVVDFAIIFAVTQFFVMVSLVAASERKFSSARALLDRTHLARVVAGLLIAALLVCFIYQLGSKDISSVQNLVLSSLAFAGFYLLPISFLLRKRFFVD